MQQFTVYVPRLPASALSLNRVGRKGSHWSAYASAKSEDEEDMRVCCLAERRWSDMPWGAVAVHVTFGIADRRKRDWDNLIARLKGFWDGLVLARVITDDNMNVVQKVSFEAQQTKNPGVWFTITKLEEPA